MAIRDSSRPVTSVMTAVVSEVAYLLQTELRLARTEIKEKLARLSNGGTFLGAAAALLISGLVILFLAAARWLAIAGVPEEWGLLLIAVVVLAAGAGLAMAGINALKSASLVPERTLEQVRADFSIAKEQVP
jgi:hypothetical protein